MSSGSRILPEQRQARRVVLKTPRLLLRLWQPDDVAPYVALNADPTVTQFLRGPVSAAQAEEFFAAQNAMVEKHGCAFLAAELRATGELAGFVGLKYQDFDAPFAPCHEIGWRLAAHCWGMGLATEGARAALAYGFDTLGLDEIVSFTVPANTRSRRVMEKLGMVRDPDGDFAHPALRADHALSRHVLYRLRRPAG
ncbi:RimJ/RimL family protein N-acetyltransferase [Pseudoduganella flava]|uniref:GNAT family N-acetyltransferase n=1 Tax=Pseudoduganella flava TaxID=871742 RepID=A0A562Q4L0_9BURK|nr:GNAT family N-acetyltransferase [Pseudoduganella flava]QGZ41671.1 GNAT family N-acetyltransferase [Pseudoduganella flava]TWI51664.1 RimJ/RimL family protein N-acetyltransferase [Pseudoduganella flava]